MSASTTPLAWAGLSLRVPSTWRIVRASGSARRGAVALADPSALKLDLAWARAPGRFDPDRALRRQLLRGLPRDARRDARIDTVAHPSLNPLLRYRGGDRTHYLGYAPQTGRAIEAVAHGDTPDAPWLATLVDQPTDAPHKWAFFGHRFMTPAGFELHSAKLDIGHMQVRLVRRRILGQWALTVRIVYPAKLALERSPMHEWLESLAIVSPSMHRPRRTKVLRRSPIRYEPTNTTLGPAVQTDSRLGWVLRLIRPTTPPLQRNCLVHDAANDRLLFVQLEAPRRAFDATIAQVLAGFHWRDT